LQYVTNYPEDEGQIRIKRTLTHEEIAQMIGSSRATAMRWLADFGKQQMLQTMGSTPVMKTKLR
jgi:CRP-like cAMP-binding protein